MSEQERFHNEKLYMVSLHILRKFLRDGKLEKEILEKMNKHNAEILNCRVIAL